MAISRRNPSLETKTPRGNSGARQVQASDRRSAERFLRQMLVAAGHAALLSSQRVAASATLAAARSGGRTRLARLFQEGAAKIRMPCVSSDPLEAVLINTAGGLTGGDRIGWNIEAGAGAS